LFHRLQSESVENPLELHLVVIVRAINALCIVRRDEAALKFPPR
jgi:hypothetical protein